MSVPSVPPSTFPWLLRIAWIAVAFTGSRAFDGVLDDVDGAARVAVYVAVGAVWVLGVAAAALPAVVSLTATRVVVPWSLVAASATWIAGAPASRVVAFGATALLATLLAFHADTGRAFVQASAYGHEDRHPLRAPVAYGMVAALAWVVATAALTAGIAWFGVGWWLPGAAATVAAAAIVTWAWPRWHRLSRRWLVLVPAGVVVHDHLVLVETLMVPAREVAGLHLAPAGTDAADLTGPATGHAVEIVTHESVTALLAPTARGDRARAIHLTACLVSPTRPGRLLRAALDRRLPVR